MKKNILIIVLIAISVVAVVIVKNKKQKVNSNTVINPNKVQSTPAYAGHANNVDSNQQKMSILPLPRVLDLGADKCMACKAMEPVLEKLREEYKGKLQVDFIDVWKNPDEAKKYNIRSIPTQIFFDKNGKEISRHTGFISEEDILEKFKEKGVLN